MGPGGTVIPHLRLSAFISGLRGACWAEEKEVSYD